MDSQSVTWQQAQRGGWLSACMPHDSQSATCWPSASHSVSYVG
jgi:hypothetical protein